MADSIQIPSGEEQHLQFLARMTDTEFASLLNAFIDAQPTFYTSRFTKRILRELGHLGDPAWEEMLGSILAIFSVIADSGQTTERVADDLAAQLLDMRSIEVEEASILRDRMRQILSADTVSMIAQINLNLFRADIFQRSRITTQVQPLYSNGTAPSEIGGLAITHELQLEVAADSKEAFRCSLDVEDLWALRREIDRALSKRKNLRKSIESSSLRLFEDPDLEGGRSEHA